MPVNQLLLMRLSSYNQNEKANLSGLMDEIINVNLAIMILKTMIIICHAP